MAKLKLTGTIETNTVKADSVKADSVNTEETLIKDSSLATVCRDSGNPDFPVDISPDDEVSLKSAVSSCFHTNYMNGEAIRNHTNRIGTLEASSGLGSGYETLQQLSGRVGEVESRSTTNQTNIATNTSDIASIESSVLDNELGLYVLGQTVDNILPDANNLPNAFVVESHPLYTSENPLEIEANSATSEMQKTFTKQGYYPLGLAGWNANGTGSTQVFFTTLYLFNQQIGVVEVWHGLRNFSSSKASVYPDIHILWAKVY